MAGVAEGAISGATAGAAFGPWGAVIGGVIGAGAGLLGGQEAPAVAPLESVDLDAASKEAIAVNERTLAGSQGLVQDTNTFNQNEANRLLEIAVPGFSRLAASLTESAQADIDNQYNLPPEIAANLERKAAEKGITRGTSGGFEDFNLLRDFGFNMVDYANSKRVSALNTLSTITGISPKVNPMSPMSMFFTPQGVADARARENEVKQAIAQGSFNAEAAVNNYNNKLLGDAAILAGTTLGGAAGDYLQNKSNTAQTAQAGTTPSASNYGSVDNPFAYGSYGELQTLGPVT